MQDNLVGVATEQGDFLARMPAFMGFAMTKTGTVTNGCSNGTCTSIDTGTNGWLFDFQHQLRSTHSAVSL